MTDNEKVMIEAFKIKHIDHNIKCDRSNTVFEALNFLSYIENLYMNESLSIPGKSTVDYYLKKNVEMIKESTKKENRFVWPYIYAPYFTPDEVRDLRGYYNEGYIYDASIRCKIETLEDRLRETNDPNEISAIYDELDSLGWTGEYDEFYESGTQFEPKSWNKKIVELVTRLKIEQDPDEINHIKQQILDLGWNPEIEYNTENQIKAIKRIENIYQERYCKNTIIIDISSIIESYDNTSNVITESGKTKLKPIHIVLIRGNGFLSPTISKIDDGPFSHSAICIDNNFDRLYSFNMDNELNFVGGFSIESIKKYPQDNRLAVFSFFVKEDTWNKINDRINMLLEHIKDTSYSVTNLLTMPFKHINLNMSNSMICSQFVDSVLKLGNIDISNKDSSKVTPNDFYRFSIKDKRIYKVFDGIAKDFNYNKISKYISNMAKKAKSFNEANISGVSALLVQYLYPVPVLEGVAPIQFNSDGDMLIKNKFIDFDAEYSSSHKLLLQYERTGNLEGMKYELARLYYINYILERRLYHNRFLKDKEKNIKTRARVLNDFKKYINYVLEKEPDFNFAEYYEQSVFYPHTIQVKNSTLLKLKDIINYIL